MVSGREYNQVGGNRESMTGKGGVNIGKANTKMRTEHEVLTMAQEREGVVRTRTGNQGTPVHSYWESMTPSPFLCASLEYVKR